MQIRQAASRDEPIFQRLVFQVPIADVLKEEVTALSSSIPRRAVTSRDGKPFVAKELVINSQFAAAKLLVRMIRLCIAKMFEEERQLPSVRQRHIDDFRGRSSDK